MFRNSWSDADPAAERPQPVEQATASRHPDTDQHTPSKNTFHCVGCNILFDTAILAVFHAITTNHHVICNLCTPVYDTHVDPSHCVQHLAQHVFNCFVENCKYKHENIMSHVCHGFFEHNDQLQQKIPIADLCQMSPLLQNMQESRGNPYYFVEHLKHLNFAQQSCPLLTLNILLYNQKFMPQGKVQFITDMVKAIKLSLKSTIPCARNLRLSDFLAPRTGTRKILKKREKLDMQSPIIFMAKRSYLNLKANNISVNFQNMHDLQSITMGNFRLSLSNNIYSSHNLNNVNTIVQNCEHRSLLIIELELAPNLDFLSQSQFLQTQINIINHFNMPYNSNIALILPLPTLTNLTKCNLKHTVAQFAAIENFCIAFGAYMGYAVIPISAVLFPSSISFNMPQCAVYKPYKNSEAMPHELSNGTLKNAAMYLEDIVQNLNL